MIFKNVSDACDSNSKIYSEEDGLNLHLGQKIIEDKL